MRIFLLVYSLASGGAERATVNLARSLVQRGHHVVVATLKEDGDFYALDSRVERLRLGVAAANQSLPRAGYNTIRRLVRVRGAIKSCKPDVVLGVMTTSAVLIALSTIGLSVFRIGWEHIHPPKAPMTRLREIVRRYAYGLLDTVVALTAKNAEWLKRNTAAKRVAIIPNFVTLPIERREPVVRPDIGVGRRILLAVGRLEQQKGFDDLIKAFAACAEGQKGWDMVILGQGSLREHLQRLVRDLRLETRVRLPGAVGNIEDWYKASSLFVMSSRFEGFPFVLIEAMASGLPAISYDCDTGPRDIISHGVDGLLVPPDDIDRLAEAMKRLMNDDTLRQRLASKAVDVASRFSENEVLRLWGKELSRSERASTDNGS